MAYLTSQTNVRDIPSTSVPHVGKSTFKSSTFKYRQNDFKLVYFDHEKKTDVDATKT